MCSAETETEQKIQGTEKTEHFYAYFELILKFDINLSPHIRRNSIFLPSFLPSFQSNQSYISYMGRSPNCSKEGAMSMLKKGAWTPEEDEKLINHINQHGYGNWRALPKKCGLQRCGKSCRLRWTNYLRPDIKRGAFTASEEQKIIQLHALVGNKWAFIASQLPKRTDNEIKNYWNTVLKKRFSQKMWWSSDSSSGLGSDPAPSTTATCAMIPERVSMLNQLILGGTKPYTSCQASRSTVMVNEQNSLETLNMWMHNMQDSSSTLTNCSPNPNSIDKVKANYSTSHIDHNNTSNKNNTTTTTTTTTLSNGSSSNSSTSHLAQWEIARLEAETRLAQQSNSVAKPKPANPNYGSSSSSSSTMAFDPKFRRAFSLDMINTTTTTSPTLPSYLDTCNILDQLTSPKYMNTNMARTANPNIISSTGSIQQSSSAAHILNSSNLSSDAILSTSPNNSNNNNNHHNHHIYNNTNAMPINTILCPASYSDTTATTSGYSSSHHDECIEFFHPSSTHIGSAKLKTITTTTTTTTTRPKCGTTSSTTSLTAHHDQQNPNVKPSGTHTSSVKFINPSGRLSWSKHELSLPNLILTSPASCQSPSPSPSPIRPMSSSPCLHRNTSDTYANDLDIASTPRSSGRARLKLDNLIRSASEPSPNHNHMNASLTGGTSANHHYNSILMMMSTSPSSCDDPIVVASNAINPTTTTTDDDTTGSHDQLDDICNLLALPSPKHMMPGIISSSSSSSSSGGLDSMNAAAASMMLHGLNFQQIETLMLDQPNHDTQFSNLLMDLNLC